MQKEQFGILLTTLKKKNGISQKEMAERLSVSTSAVSKWEHGKNLPDITMLGSIAEILQVSCDELLNPEMTLERLANSELQKGDTEETDGESPKKKSSRIVKTVILTVIAVNVIGMILLYMAVHGKVDFEQVGVRYIDDPSWGKVYEIAAVVYGRVDADRLIMYMKEVEAQVKEGPELETDTVRITYFKNKSDALKWENPESYCYIFLDAE